jgi:hypothetical protein
MTARIRPISSHNRCVVERARPSTRSFDDDVTIESRTPLESGVRETNVFRDCLVLREVEVCSSTAERETAA